MSPYIQPERRPRIDHGVTDALEGIDNPGDLNYAISRLCLGYLAKSTKPSYHRYNSVMGVLACASHELYFRHISPHEAEARKRNGDVC